MDQNTYNALQRVVDYMWSEERKHWEEAGKPEVHIYRDLIALDKWSQEESKNQ